MSASSIRPVVPEKAKNRRAEESLTHTIGGACVHLPAVSYFAFSNERPAQGKTPKRRADGQASDLRLRTYSTYSTHTDVFVRQKGNISEKK